MSPLLQLPAEDRNIIWELVLGGQVLQSIPTSRPLTLAPSSIEHSGMAVLCVCRSIYAESASLPLPMSTFVFKSERYPISEIF